MSDDGSLGKIPSPEEYGVQIARLNAEQLQQRQILEWHAKSIEKLESNYNQLTVQQAETKTLVTQVLSQISTLDNKLFGVFQQLTKDNSNLLQQITKEHSKERVAGSKERTTAQTKWIGFGKYVAMITVGALITYLLTGGGK